MRLLRTEWRPAYGDADSFKAKRLPMHLLANRVVGNDQLSKASIVKVPQKHRHVYAQLYSDSGCSSALKREVGIMLPVPHSCLIVASTC